MKINEVFKNILDFIRIKQWYKNIIIFIPLVFSFEFFVVDKLFITVIGFIAISFVSSACYVRNDIEDVEQDKLHPSKKFRVLASGLLKKRQAWAIFISLIVFGFGIGFLLDYVFSILLLILFLNTEIYSRWIKKIIFVDVFVIGINFIIRALAGIILLQTSLSPWIILGVFFVALFLAFLKRKSELISLADVAQKHRESLKEYSEYSLNTGILISGIMIITTYSLYAINGPNNDWRLIITVPFIIFVILRQIHLSNVKNKTNSSNEIIRDKQSLLTLLIYGIITFVLIYLGPTKLFNL
jgi:4-hydroxybenzoate polyprenyltransferase